ncbi:hypothetical protein G4O51_01120 [Candidatus Bathyarchaeota archaeon A05DMB-2]|nr:hypothetical protein [Candidatus Bathyarchaeota archaeon A05DMB-2]
MPDHSIGDARKMIKRAAVVVAVFAVIFLALATQSVKAQGASAPVNVQVGTWLVNVEKVDLSANSYRLDFYLWFRFNPSEISIDEVRNFEFINGAPTKYEVYANATQGYLEYRVRGDFITSFDFTRYPFESHELSVELEHKSLDASSLVYSEDQESAIEPTANVAGWDLGGFQTSNTLHSYGDTTYSRFVFSVNLARPAVSAFIKSVLPIAVITVISLLSFFMAPQNFAQRITLGVTTLLAATTFHLSLLSGIPPTGYLTFADRMMISVYVIFLYNLACSVYIMRLVDLKRVDDAARVKSKALKFLPVLIVAILILQAVL